MSFVSEKPIKAVRKRHLCSACDKWIEIGESAINWAGMADGDFSSVHYHPECRAAEVAYNRDCLDLQWPGDEWNRLCEAESDNHSWIKAEHPIAYLRMCMTREQWAARTPPERTDNAS